MNSKRFAWFVLRWLLLGWWAVPLLILALLFLCILDPGDWTGSGCELHWNKSDPDIDAAIEWCCCRLRTFFTV